MYLHDSCSLIRKNIQQRGLIIGQVVNCIYFTATLFKRSFLAEGGVCWHLFCCDTWEI